MKETYNKHDKKALFGVTLHLFDYNMDPETFETLDILDESCVERFEVDPHVPGGQRYSIQCVDL